MTDYAKDSLIEYLFKELMEYKRLVESYRKCRDEQIETEHKYEYKIMELEDKNDEQAEHIQWLESLLSKARAELLEVKEQKEILGLALDDAFDKTPDYQPIDVFKALDPYFAPSTSREEEKVAKAYNDAIDEALNDHQGEGE